MKEKKKSAVSWILTWAGQKRIAYVWSVLLAIGNVIFKILPYFIIADVVKLFLNGEKEFKTYLAKAVLIALSFIIAGAYCPGIHVKSAGAGCDFNLFLSDRLETGTLVFGSSYRWTFLLFWNDAGL